MYYSHHTPAPPLSDFVEFLWCLTEGPTHSAERILPCAAPELVINLRDNEIRIGNAGPGRTLQRLSGVVVAGPYSHSFDIDASRHTAMLGVHFKPGGVAAVLGVPPSEILDTHLDLEQLWPSGADTLRERVCESAAVADRFAIVEAALTSRLRGDLLPPPSVACAVATLLPGPSHPPIGDLAEDAGLSHRQFIKEFTTSVGMTPKLFARVRRFRYATSRMRFSRPPSWSEFAVECGYADQAHMIRDFQSFSGLTPVQQWSRRHLATKEHHVALGA